jgi:lipoprotein-releasing system ATP-binding protein
MLLRLNHISKHYGSESEGTLRKVLDELSLEIKKGESIAILGPSGSGKTTLLNIMGTLDRPDSGDVFFQDRHPVLNGKEPMDLKSDLRITDKSAATLSSDFQPTKQPEVLNLFSPRDNLVNYSTKELDTFRNQKIGFVFQMHQLLPQCTLLENILIPTLTINDKTIKAERLIRAKELMERVGIWAHRDQMPGHLSGGECQRAAVVRALINNPGLLLADEPTGALDEDNVSKLALLLLEINKTDGVTLVVVTHSVALAARMDTVYELRNGKLRLKDIKA